MKINKMCIFFYFSMLISLILIYILGYFVNDDYDYSNLLTLLLFGSACFFFVYYAIKFTDWLFNKKLYYFYRYGFLILSSIGIIVVVGFCISDKYIDDAIFLPLSVFASSLCSLLNKKDDSNEAKNENPKA